MSFTEQEKKDLQYAWIFLLKRKYLWGISLLIGTTIGLSLCYVATPAYSSQTTLLPANTTDNQLAGGSSRFGLEMHADQLIAILSCEMMKDSILKKSKWLLHYNYPQPLSAPDRARAYALLDKQIHYQRTIQLSIIATATTSSPALSQEMLTIILEDAEEVYNLVLQNSLRPAYEHAEAEFQQQDKKFSTLKKTVWQQIDTMNHPEYTAEKLKRQALANTRSLLLNRLEAYFYPLYIVKKPTLPLSPSFPQQKKVIFSSLLLTLLSSFIGALFLHIIRNKPHS